MGNICRLRNTNFVLFAAGRLLSEIGDRTDDIALLTAIYRLEQSAMALGWFTLIKGVPSLLLGSLAGVLSDWFEKKRIMILMDLLRAAVIAVLFLHPEPTFWILVTLGTILELLSIADEPARSSFLPFLVDNESLLKANAVFSTINSVLMIAGPALGGLIVGTYGFRAGFAVDALSYVSSACLLLLIGVTSVNQEKSSLRDVTVFPRLGEFYRSWIDSLRHVWGNHTIRNIIATFCIMVLASGGGSIALLVYADSVLELGASGYGVITAAVGAGILSGSIILPRFEKTSRETLLFLGLVGMGFTLMLVSQAQVLHVAVALMAAHGVFQSITMVSSQTLLHISTDKSYLGRVAAVSQSLYTLIAMLSVPVSAMLLESTGPSKTLFIQAVVVLIAGAFARMILPRYSEKMSVVG